MKFSLTADQISAMIADGVSKALAAQGAAPSQPKASPFLAKGQKADPSSLAAKDAKIVAAFARKGFKVTLMNRADPSQPYDVRPYKSWIALGYVPRKGSRSVMGSFHQTQCDKIAKDSPEKPKKAKKA